MDDDLQLTARGHAVCELMCSAGLSLEAACERVEHELEALRTSVEKILSDRPWEDMPSAVRAALAGVSYHVQSAYLEEQRPASASVSLSA